MINGVVEQLQKDNYLTLVFDAWKYRHEKNLILPLLCAIQREHLPASDSVKKIVGCVAVASLAGYLKHKTGIDLGDIRSTLEMYEDGYQHYKKYDDHVAKIEQEYKDFIVNLLEKTGKKKLVIFVDNLDRCLPDIVVNLLEDISSFLSIGDVPCIYVLAMDKDNVLNAIKHRFQDFDGAHYLEKIVQIPLKMPFAQQNSKGDGSAGRYHFMKRYEWGKMYEKDSSSGDARDKVYKELAKVDAIFNGDLLSNPRRIERIINKLMILEASRFFDAEKSPDDISALIFLLLLAEYFPKVYGFLEQDEDYKHLLEYLQASDQKATEPWRIRKERESKPHTVIVDEYCDNPRFYPFLRLFIKLQSAPGFTDRLKRIRTFLNLVG